MVTISLALCALQGCIQCMNANKYGRDLLSKWIPLDIPLRGSVTGDGHCSVRKPAPVFFPNLDAAGRVLIPELPKTQRTHTPLSIDDNHLTNTSYLIEHTRARRIVCVVTRARLVPHFLPGLPTPPIPLLLLPQALVGYRDEQGILA